MVSATLMVEEVMEDRTGIYRCSSTYDAVMSG
jgi:hypothetical protein